MRPIILSVASVILLWVSSARGESPNVVLILADDLAIGDLSCFNKGISRTPNLDRLIENSVYFRHAYSGSPVCAPSRAALLTGRYPHRTGSVTLNQRSFPHLTRLKLDEITIADRFSRNGYITGLVGKWHSGPGKDYHPLNRGFDEFSGFNESSDIKTYFRYQLDIQGEYRDFEGPNLTDELTRFAIEFVRKHRDKPFFLHLAHYAPHRPLSAPEELIAFYTQRGIDPKTAKVYAMIEVMDTGIGELLAELESLQLNRKTIVIFTSDNGPDPLVGDRFNLENRGTKYMVNEGGIHVPFLISWPGHFDPVNRDEVIHFTDVVPTLMDLCDFEPGEIGKPLDGASFAGLLRNEGTLTSLPVNRFWQWNRSVPDYSHNAAIREGSMKLVRPYITRNIPESSSQRDARLYDLSVDPMEMNDISSRFPGVRERLSRELERICVEVENERNRAVKEN